MDMPMKKKRTVASQAAARGPLPALPDALIDELVKGPMTPAEVQDLMRAFNKALIERAMGAEMNMHLGYRPGEPKPSGQTNERNGASGKTVITDRGPVRVDLPRDRDGSFEPLLVPKHARRFTAFDDSIVALYARGHGQVGVEDVAAVVSDASALAIEDIVDAAFAGRPGELEIQLGKARTAGSAGSILFNAQRQLAQLHKWRLAIEQGKAFSLEAVSPPLPFRRRPLLEAALKAWSAARLGNAMADLADAVLQSRRNPALADTIAERALLAIAASGRRSAA